MTVPPAPYAGAVPRSGLLAAVGGATIVVYVAGSPYYIAGSLTAGDLWMLPALALVLLSDTAARNVLRLLAGAYGWIALCFTAAAAVASLHATDFLHSLLIAGQFLFTVWIVVPVVAAGVADMRDPLAFLRRSGAAYLLFYALGLVLLFGFRNDVILYQSAIGRVFQRFVTFVFQTGLMGVGLAGAAFGARHRGRDLTLLILSLIPVLLNASRTGLVSYGAITLLALLLTARDGKRLLLVTLGAILLVVIGQAITSSKLVHDMWQVRVLTASGFVEDDIRMASIRASLAAIRSSVLTLLFGTGWGTSGGEIVVHDFVIQVTHEAGLFVLAALAALFALPVVWAFARGAADRMLRHTILFTMAVFVLFWLLNALSVERPYWLPYAVALGLAQRLRLDRPPRVRIEPERTAPAAPAPAFA
ncbi:MAG TPA: hypothetical protein VFK09_10190 [Gemmatimonadales bacterium]|jgi:hypothetical protein|nr:hypothetical protein [Gemmatimonadales bacterium]